MLLLEALVLAVFCVVVLPDEIRGKLDLDFCEPLVRHASATVLLPPVARWFQRVVALFSTRVVFRHFSAPLAPRFVHDLDLPSVHEEALTAPCFDALAISRRTLRLLSGRSQLRLVSAITISTNPVVVEPALPESMNADGTSKVSTGKCSFFPVASVWNLVFERL